MPQTLNIRLLRTLAYRCALFLMFPFVMGGLTTENAYAQSQIDSRLSETSPAIMNVINMLLLDDTPGGPIKINFDKNDPRHYGYNYGQGNYKEGLELHFTAQAEDVTLCFDAVDVQAGEVLLELNGDSIGELISGTNCYTFTPSQTIAGDNILVFIHTRPGERWGITNIIHDYLRGKWLTLPKVIASEWDNLAVRKVLQVFAFGGQASDQQIQTWANMDAEAAIKQILNFMPHNSKLSPLPAGEKYPQVASQDGTFWTFREYLGDLTTISPIPVDPNPDADNYQRRGLGVDSGLSQSAWVRMTTARGLNPFRQKIGYWETNFHLAVNLDTAVTHRQLTYYYDLIMNAHEVGKPYEEVIAEAAKSAAVAHQYGHQENIWVRESIDGGYRNGDYICECNEDFAREIHQLFFGILGDQDPQGLAHHEDVTIPETAKALTDMRVEWDEVNERFPEIIDFQTEYHHSAAVDVLNTQINGVDAAAKIDAIVDIAITHPESLATLPIMIISGLADDDLSAQEKQQLRVAWAAMPSKKLLEFVQAYAVSKMFHAADRVKYFPSIDRFVYIANKLTLNNTEALLERYNVASTYAPARGLSRENVEVFRPLHNVFGAQTGLEAADSPAVMENNYNRFTVAEYSQSNSRCDDCDFGGEWRKDWATVIPKVGGEYRVDDVAEWLWQHFVGDGGKRYKTAERAHMLALMATDRDLNQILCVKTRRAAESVVPSQYEIDQDFTPLELLERDQPSPQRCDTDFSSVELQLLEKGFSLAELESPEIAALIDDMGNRQLLLDSSDLEARRRANEEIGQGINFILATPFIMAQEAR